MTRMDGRRAQAARNDGKILDAARAVFLADPQAPIASVAERAGVGISALYGRYGNKQGLVEALARDGLTRFVADLEIALDDHGDAWTAYSECLIRVLDGQSQALAQQLAGRFAPSVELTALAAHAGQLYEKLHERTRRAKALRRDVSAADVIVLLETISLVDLPGDNAALRRRYLALVLQALHDTSAPKLPGRAVTDAQLARRWREGQPSRAST